MQMLMLMLILISKHDQCILIFTGESLPSGSNRGCNPPALPPSPTHLCHPLLRPTHNTDHQREVNTIGHFFVNISQCVNLFILSWKTLLLHLLLFCRSRRRKRDKQLSNGESRFWNIFQFWNFEIWLNFKFGSELWLVMRIPIPDESPRSPLVTEQLYFQQKEHLSYHEYQVNEDDRKFCDEEDNTSGWLLSLCNDLVWSRRTALTIVFY